YGQFDGRHLAKTEPDGAGGSRRIGMKRHVMPLLVVVSLLLGACTPASQPASGQPSATAPAPGQAAPAQSKPAESKPAEAAKPAAQASGPVTFLSSQFKPVEEAEKMRGTILKGAPGQVEFIPEDPGPFNDRITAEQQAKKVTISLIGG